MTPMCICNNKEPVKPINLLQKQPTKKFICAIDEQQLYVLNHFDVNCKRAYIIEIIAIIILMVKIKRSIRNKNKENV